MLFNGKISSYDVARLTARYWVSYLLRFATIRHYSPLFATFRHYSPLFSTIRHYSPLFTTIRHYSHYSYYSLFRTIRCSLFATIRYSLFGFSRHPFQTVHELQNIRNSLEPTVLTTQRFST